MYHMLKHQPKKENIILTGNKYLKSKLNQTKKGSKRGKIITVDKHKNA